MGIIIGLFALVFSTAVAILTFGYVNSSQKDLIRNTHNSKAVDIAVAGLNIARESLINDGNWADCSGANLNCNQANALGYYPLYSESLTQTIENYPVNGGELTLYIKPVDSSQIKVVAVGKYAGEEFYIGALFQKVAGETFVPIAYGGQGTTMYGGTLCSYFWDGTRVVGTTLPNFTSLLDTTTYISAQILIPNNPAGNNPKQVVFGTDFDTLVNGYQNIDILYSTGDVSVINGAVVDTVIANGTVTVDDTSTVNNIQENAGWEFPNYNSQFTDNDETMYTLTSPNQGDVVCDSTNPNLILQSGVYTRLLIYDGCQSITVQGDVVEITDYIYNASDVQIIPTAENTIIRTDTVYNLGNMEVVSDNSSFLLQTFDFNNGIQWGRFSIEGSFYCSNPGNCLIDTNDFDNSSGSTVQSVIIGRNQITGDDGSVFIGNLIGETIYTTDATVCNIVDENGNEVGTTGVYQDTIFQILDPTGQYSSSVVSQVQKVICSDLEDCDANL